MTEHEEVPLQGGNVSAGIMRVGDTVRRPTGPWTPAVHALLRHLEEVGFGGAPRVLDIDDDGREVLSFVRGPRAWPENFEAVGSDNGLLEVARLVRRYHDAVESFVPPADSKWNDAAPSSEPCEIVCHNDLAPWNLILEPAGRWAFIDWDMAAPGSRLSDLACTARNFVPMFPEFPDTWPFAHRLALLASAWELPVEDLMSATVARARAETDRFRALAASGRQPWERLWRTGHGASSEAIARFVADSASRWITEIDQARR